jgi:hypothetical protein
MTEKQICVDNLSDKLYASLTQWCMTCHPVHEQKQADACKTCDRRTLTADELTALSSSAVMQGKAHAAVLPNKRDTSGGTPHAH